MSKTVLFLTALLIGLGLGWYLSGCTTVSLPPPAPYEPPSTSSAPLEIHTKHVLYGLPTGTPGTNDLIIRDIYALSSNDQTKLADWVAYRLDDATVNGQDEQSRQWRADPWLSEEETLEPDDFKGAYASIGVDRGHQAPLASFRGSPAWRESNYLSNITPQFSELNQGPWRILEERERDLLDTYDEVYVLTGPLYERDMPQLPEADEPHRIPSGYWKIVAVPAGRDEWLSASFIFEQTAPRSAKVLSGLATIDEVEARAGLDFFRDLPDTQENSFERNRNDTWAAQHFDN